MRILFIFPSVGRKPGDEYVASWKMEPLSFAVLAALTPSEHETQFFDDRLEEIPMDQTADLVVMSVETYTARRAYSIAAHFRKRGFPVVLGGFHPTLLPGEAEEHCDAVIVGDGEDVWPSLLKDVQRKELKKRYVSKCLPLNGLLPNRCIYEEKKYLPVLLVESARGCLFHCQFCSVTNFFNGTYRTRPVQSIVQEIQSLQKRLIFFIDDNLTMNASRAKELFKALIPLNIRWFGQGSIHAAEDEELLVLMKKSGCLGILIGFESLNSENLVQMNKPVRNGGMAYIPSIRKLRDHGIMIYGTFVFGYDQDDRDSFARTLDFAIEQKFLMAAFNHMVPFPGTPFYSQLKSQGRLIFDQWWLEPSYKFGDVAFRPKNMTAEELARGCVETRRKFYNASSIWKRFFDPNTHAKDISSMWRYWFLNVFSRQGVEERQGLPLG